MRSSKLLLLTILLLLSSTLIQAEWIPFYTGAISNESAKGIVTNESSISTELEFTFPGFEKNDIVAGTEKYQKISILGCGVIGKSGFPSIPLIKRFLEVSTNASANITVLSASYTTLNGYNLYPEQINPLAITTGSSIFQKNNTLYSTNTFYPAEIATLENVSKLREQPILPVVINPVQFNPVTKEIRVYSKIKVSITYTYAASGWYLPPSISTNKKSIEFESILGSLTSNHKTPTQLPAPVAVSTIGAQYLIITYDDFYNEALQLANYKTSKKGITAKVVKTSEIPGGATSENIRNFIINAYNTWSPAPVYLLLFGDAEQIPPNYLRCELDPYANDGTRPPSDLYYATVDNDYLPDLLVGRLAVNTKASAQAVVNKIINYENNTANAAWKKKIIFLADFQDNNPADGQENMPFLNTIDRVHYQYLKNVPNLVLSRIYTDYNNTFATKKYSNGSIIPSDTPYLTSYTAGSNQLISEINNGASIIDHYSHGYENGFQGLSISDFSKLTNGEKLPLFLGAACLTGSFDGKECFGESLVEKENGGAIGYIGSTRVSWTWSDDNLSNGWMATIWPKMLDSTNNSSGSKKLGVILTNSKLKMYQLQGASSFTKLHLEMFTLFGDPELDLQIGEKADLLPPTAPTALSVSAISANKVKFSWNPSTDDVGPLSYIVSYSSITVTTASTIITSNYLMPGSTYTFSVKAKDLSGKISATTSMQYTLPADIEAPSIPKNLNVQNTGIFTINWDYSTDNDLIQKFEVMQTVDGVSSMLSAGSYNSIMFDYQPGKVYYFKVRSMDRSKNYSAYSAEIKFPADVKKTLPQVYIRGTCNNWLTSDKMTLISDNTWQITKTFSGTNNDRFKFDINGDWTLNFGDNAPINGIADQTGSDILITQGAGEYVITFNDLTKAYTVVKNTKSLTISSNSSTIMKGESTFKLPATGTYNANGVQTTVTLSWSPALDVTKLGQTLYTASYGGLNVQYTLTVNELGLKKIYSQVYIRGTCNNWTLSDKMTFISDYTWQIVKTFSGNSDDRFKFDINGDWTLNFGDNAPVNGIADQTGSDIAVTQGAGDYIITFNDSTKAYTVVKKSSPNSQLVSTYSQVYLKGSCNNWTNSDKMTLTANNTWEITKYFSGSTQERFKFDINGDWTLNFGDNSPANGIADQTGSDISVPSISGNYKIIFNDATKAYSVTKL